MMQPGQEYTERENVALSLPELTGKLLHDAGYGSMAGKRAAIWEAARGILWDVRPVPAAPWLHGRNTGPWNFAIFPVVMGCGSFRGEAARILPRPRPSGKLPAGFMANFAVHACKGGVRFFPVDAARCQIAPGVSGPLPRLHDGDFRRLHGFMFREAAPAVIQLHG